MPELELFNNLIIAGTNMKNINLHWRQALWVQQHVSTVCRGCGSVIAARPSASGLMICHARGTETKSSLMLKPNELCTNPQYIQDPETFSFEVSSGRRISTIPDENSFKLKSIDKY